MGFEDLEELLVGPVGGRSWLPGQRPPEIGRFPIRLLFLDLLSLECLYLYRLSLLVQLLFVQYRLHGILGFLGLAIWPLLFQRRLGWRCL